VSKIIEHYMKSIQGEELDENFIEESFTAVLGGVYTATMLLKYSADLAQNYLTKAGKECSHLTGGSKNLCMIDFKIRALTKQMSEIMNSKSKCRQARNKEGCIQTLDRKIKKIRAVLVDLHKHKLLFQTNVRNEKKKNEVHE